MARSRRWAIGLIAALLWVAPVASGPPPVRAADCPDSPLTVDDLLGLWDGKVLGFMGYVNPAGRRCYGAADIRVVGYVGNARGMGYEAPFTLEPGWLGQPGLFLFASPDTRLANGAVAPYYALQWPGDGLQLQRRYLRDWVSVTAHFDDARARTCTAWDPTGIVESKAALRRMCRSLLVISAVTRIAGPDTATAGPVSGRTGVGSGGPQGIALLAAALVGLWIGWRRTSTPRSRLPG